MVRDRDRLLRTDRVGYGRTPREGHARARPQMRTLLEGPAGSGDARHASDAVPEMRGRSRVRPGLPHGVMRPRLFSLGLLAGAVVLVADQASKWWILQVLDLRKLGQVVLLPVLNLTMVWNRGVTFGL